MAPADFVAARNPDPESTLPYLIRLPLGPTGIVLKARDTWSRIAKVYCHSAASWPDDPDVIERVAVRSGERRGAAIDLILDRSRENRSQIVFTRTGAAGRRSSGRPPAPPSRPGPTSASLGNEAWPVP